MERGTYDRLVREAVLAHDAERELDTAVADIIDLLGGMDRAKDRHSWRLEIFRKLKAISGCRSALAEQSRAYLELLALMPLENGCPAPPGIARCLERDLSLPRDGFRLTMLERPPWAGLENACGAYGIHGNDRHGGYERRK